MEIPTVTIVCDEEDPALPWCVIDDDTGRCLGVFDDEDQAVEWANRHGYDIS